jgi:hypothetical protein
MNKKQAGQIGGRTTFARHGEQHMSKIGARGAAVTWQRYFLSAIGGTGWVMVNRQTNELKAVINFAGR